MRPKVKHRAAGIRKIDSDLHEVRQRRRVLVRMRRVDVEEAAAVGAEHLDRDLRSGRAHRQRLLVGALVLHHRLALVVLQRLAVGARLGLLVLHDLERLHFLVGVEVLHHALLHQERARARTTIGSSTHSVTRVRSTQALPMPWRRGARSRGSSAIDDDDAGGGRQEVLHRRGPASASGSSSSVSPP